jgi:PAS domain-containing protein
LALRAQVCLPDQIAKQSTARTGEVRGGAVSEQADLFRLLIQSIREYAIFVLDPSGNVLTWNPGAQAMKDYAKEEIVGKHFSQFYPAANGTQRLAGTRAGAGGQRRAFCR